MRHLIPEYIIIIMDLSSVVLTSLDCDYEKCILKSSNSSNDLNKCILFICVINTNTIHLYSNYLYGTILFTSYLFMHSTFTELRLQTIIVLSLFQIIIFSLFQSYLIM